jgi:hypothetical protein
MDRLNGVTSGGRQVRCLLRRQCAGTEPFVLQLPFYDIPWPIAMPARSFDELQASAIQHFLLSPYHSTIGTRKMRSVGDVAPRRESQPRRISHMFLSFNCPVCASVLVFFPTALTFLLFLCQKFTQRFVDRTAEPHYNAILTTLNLVARTITELMHEFD